MHEAQLFLHLLAELHTSPGDSPNSAASNTPADLLLESCHGGRAVAQVLEAAPKSPKNRNPFKNAGKLRKGVTRGRPPPGAGVSARPRLAARPGARPRLKPWPGLGSDSELLS